MAFGLLMNTEIQMIKCKKCVVKNGLEVQQSKTKIMKLVAMSTSKTFLKF